MKKILLGWLGLVVFGVTVADAMPRIPHSIKGRVQAVDVEKRVLQIEAQKKAGPTEFAIVEGRTKLRRDQKPATLADLAPGQSIQLYYYLESNRYIASEVNWVSAPRSDDPKK